MGLPTRGRVSLASCWFRAAMSAGGNEDLVAEHSLIVAIQAARCSPYASALCPAGMSYRALGRTRPCQVIECTRCRRGPPWTTGGADYCDRAIAEVCRRFRGSNACTGSRRAPWYGIRLPQPEAEIVVTG